MNQESSIVSYGEMVVRQRIPENENNAQLILLLHGWTGDENSMWIFTPRLPDDYLIIAPRGITRTPLGGFGWQQEGVAGWPGAADFSEAIQKIFDLVDGLNLPGFNGDRFDVMGFSQGAALAYTMLLKYPQRIRKLAGVSGFLPAGLGGEISTKVLSGKQVFVSHGTQDEMVSLDRARHTVGDLKSAGADVIYCEEDVGHKLSANCFRAMDGYFSEM